MFVKFFLENFEMGKSFIPAALEGFFPRPTTSFRLFKTKRKMDIKTECPVYPFHNIS